MTGFAMDLSMMIPSLVESVLDRSVSPTYNDDRSTTHNGVVLGIEMTLSRPWGDDESKRSERHATVFLMFYGNTSVWFAAPEGDERWFSWREIPLDRWENTSNHDSCWRSDGLRCLTNLYFEMSSDIDENIAPKDMNQFVRFAGFGRNVFNHVQVTQRRAPRSKGNSYWFESELVSIEDATK